LQPRRCVPSTESLKNMRKSVTEALSTSKAAIKESVRKGGGLDPKLSQSGTLEALGKRLYGWQKAFAFCTDPQPFQHLDDFVSAQVVDYQGFIGRMTKSAPAPLQMLIYGIPATKDMFEKARKSP
jgi:RNA-directed DNA polymerase